MRRPTPCFDGWLARVARELAARGQKADLARYLSKRYGRPARSWESTLAQILDASLSGVRISHVAQIAGQKRCNISLDWRGTPIEFVAELRWTKEQKGEYESGFEIQKIEPSAISALRGLVNECAAQMPLYERHELIHGVWRTTTTTDSWQPDVGFTVSATGSTSRSLPAIPEWHTRRQSTV